MTTVPSPRSLRTGWIVFSELNLSLDALAVLGALQLHCRSNSHGRWRGQCPFHHSESRLHRSLAVDLVNRVWYCHRCKRGGDLIDLYAGVKHLTLRAAALELRAYSSL